METKAKQVRLVEAIGDELAALVAPLTPQAFVNEYWGKKPLHVKGFRDKFKGFFDSDAFYRALPDSSRPGSLHASFDKKIAPPAPSGGQPVDGTKVFAIAPTLVGPLYEAGATICMSEIEARVPRLAFFAAAIKRQLGHAGPVAFNSYLSPPGVGFNWHFDGRIASTLQIEGSKRWRYSKRVALEWPRGNGVLLSDGSARYDLDLARAEWERLATLDKGAIAEVVLEPGDFLMLPAGTWHDAAGGASGSLALNLAFNPVPYSFVLTELLGSVLGSDPAWRCARPLVGKMGGAPGEVDPRALEALKAQLEKGADSLQSMAADGSALVALWSALVQEKSPPVERPSATANPSIVATDRFRVRADGNFYVRTVEGGARLSIAIGARHRVEVSGLAMRFAQRALEARKFDASECAGWGGEGVRVEWDDIAKTLENLVQEGLLERIAK